MGAQRLCAFLLILLNIFQHLEPRKPPHKANVIIYNCEDRASAKCQLFQTWRFGKETCDLLEMKNQVWSPMFQNMHPLLICPYSQGNYTLRNGSLNIQSLKVLPFPLEQYYWRVRMEAYDPLLYFCTVMGAQILRSFI